MYHCISSTGRPPGDSFFDFISYTDLAAGTDNNCKEAKREVGYEKGLYGTGIYS